MLLDTLVHLAARNGDLFTYAWGCAERSDDPRMLVSLAASDHLPAEIRKDALTHSRQDVRAEFAARTDLEPHELEHLLTKEKVASVTAAALSRPLPPDVLRDLAARGRATLLDSLIRRSGVCGLSQEPQAVVACLNRALSRAPRSQTEYRELANMAVPLGKQYVQQLAVPVDADGGLVTGISANQHIWHVPGLVRAIVSSMLAKKQALNSYQYLHLLGGVLTGLEGGLDRAAGEDAIHVDDELAQALSQSMSDYRKMHNRPFPLSNLSAVSAPTEERREWLNAHGSGTDTRAHVEAAIARVNAASLEEVVDVVAQFFQNAGTPLELAGMRAVAGAALRRGALASAVLDLYPWPPEVDQLWSYVADLDNRRDFLVAALNHPAIGGDGEYWLTVGDLLNDGNDRDLELRRMWLSRCPNVIEQHYAQRLARMSLNPVLLGDVPARMCLRPAWDTSGSEHLLWLLAELSVSDGDGTKLRLAESLLPTWQGTLRELVDTVRSATQSAPR